MTAKLALKLREQSHRKTAIASKTDPLRRQFDLGEARLLKEESTDLLTPSQPLVSGLGGEIVPPYDWVWAGWNWRLKSLIYLTPR